MNLFDEILNAVGNVDDQEDHGFIGSFFSIYHIIIDDKTKNKLINIQLETWDHREIYRILTKIWWNKSDQYNWWQGILWKRSDWWKQGKSLNKDIEFLNLRKLSSKRYINNVEKESDGINQMGMSYDKESDEKY